MMSQCLDAVAYERIQNIRSVKPEKAEAIENIIIGNFQQGKVSGKISDAALTDLINQFNDQVGNGVQVVMKRKNDIDDDLDLDNLDL